MYATFIFVSEESPGVEPRPVHVAPAEEVRIPLAAAVLGLTPKAIRRKIEDGAWREGHEYFRRDGEIWVSLKGVSRWIRSDEKRG